MRKPHRPAPDALMAVVAITDMSHMMMVDPLRGSLPSPGGEGRCRQWGPRGARSARRSNRKGQAPLLCPLAPPRGAPDRGVGTIRNRPARTPNKWPGLSRPDRAPGAWSRNGRTWRRPAGRAPGGRALGPARADGPLHAHARPPRRQVMFIPVLALLTRRVI